MLYLMAAVSLILTVFVNIATSVYVCYSVTQDADQPVSTLTTVGCLVLINALFPYMLGCATGLWYMG